MIFHFLILDIFLMLAQKTRDRFIEFLKANVNTVWLRLVLVSMCLYKKYIQNKFIYRHISMSLFCSILYLVYVFNKITRFFILYHICKYINNNGSV